MTESIRLLK